MDQKLLKKLPKILSKICQNLVEIFARNSKRPGKMMKKKKIGGS
jgi:hypothetical protein